VAIVVRFWGTRGSIPVALTTPELKRKLVNALVKATGQDLATPEKAGAFVDTHLDFAVSHTFGGHSSCVELEAGGDEYVVCDLGSGARAFGNRVLATRGPSGHTFHVFMSHAHWDHISGFPFFMPAYYPGNRIRIYGGHEALDAAFRRQNAAPSFPVDFSKMEADIEFERLETGRDYEVAGLRVRALLQRHPGQSYGYRFEKDGKVVVYSTDSEHKPDDFAEADRFVQFFRDADLVIFDAMYSLADANSVKENWGHSSNVVGVELCQRAGARHMCMFHHEPVHDDETLVGLLRETRRLEEITRTGRPLEISAAWDGMEIEI